MIKTLRDDPKINNTMEHVRNMSMSRESLVFGELRPLCIDVSRLSFQPKETFDPQSTPLQDALKNLENRLASYTDQLSTKLADYVFVPISSLLKQDSLGKSQTNYVLLIIAHLLRLAWRSDGTLGKTLAQQLLPLITFLINPDKDNESLIGSSEDDKRAACSALFQFITSLSHQSYCHEFFSASDPNRLNALGHSVSILLAILHQSSQDIETQLIAIGALQILYRDIIHDGEMLSFILPGNISTFCKVLTMPGLTTNYKVALSILDVMGDLLLLIYDDTSLNAVQHELKDLKQLNFITDRKGDSTFGLVEINTSGGAEPRQHRSTSWLRGTSSQVKLALEKILPKLLKRKNSEISAALVKFASAMLERCHNSLQNCENLFVKVLIEVRTDPNFQLASHVACLRNIVRDGFEQLNQWVHIEDGNALKSLNFALISLRDVASKDDVLFIPNVCSRLIETLETATEVSALKQRDYSIIEQSSQVILNDALNQELIRADGMPTVLTNIAKEVEVSLGRILSTLGSLAYKHGQLTSLIDAVLSTQTCEGSSRKKIALWISSWLVSGISEASLKSENDYLNIDSDEILDKEACYDVLEFGSDLAQAVVMQSEGVGLTASSEGSLIVVLQSIELVCNSLKEEFSSELMDCLYIVVENLGSSSPKVRHFAQSCALTISHVLYNDSLQQLILSNVDYLADSISSRLNSGMTERVSTVFMVICRIAGYETIESFKDIIETIFKLLDYYHGYSEMCLQFFQLFEVIALEIQKKYLSTNDEQSRLTHEQKPNRGDAPWGMTSLSQVLAVMDKQSTNDDEIESMEEDKPKNFQEYFDSKLRELDSDDEEESEQENIGNEPESVEVEAKGDQWVSPIPRKSYRILLQILGYGDRLLTHRSKSLRVQILCCTKLILPMLATQYDSLLPQVAQIWNTLALCSLDNDYSIVKPACDCLQEVILCAGDFVTTRFLELWKTWNDKSALLKELKLTNQDDTEAFTYLVPHRKFPTITELALISLSRVLLEGILAAGLMLPDTTAREMLTCCIQILPSESIASRSLMLGDMVFAITHEV